MGLNDDFLTDDEESTLTMSPAPLEEGPDLQEDQAQVAALETQMIDLFYALEDIGRAGGMNQAIALEAEKALPGFLNDNRPLGYFSKMPSATLHRVALEELSKGIWALIAAAAAAALVILYKIFKWLFGGDKADTKDSGGGKIQTAKLEEEHKARQETAEAAKDALTEASKEFDLKKIEAELNQNAESNIHKLMKELNPVFHELVYKRTLYTKFVTLIKVLDNYIGIIDIRVREFHKVVIDDLGSFDSEDEFKKTFYFSKFKANDDNDLKHPIEIQLDGKKLSPTEAYRSLEDHYQHVHNSPPQHVNDLLEFVTKYEELVQNDTVIREFKTTVEHSKQCIADATTYLDYVQNQALKEDRQYIKREGVDAEISNKLTKEYVADMRTINGNLMQSVQALGKMLNLLDTVLIGGFKQLDLIVKAITKEVQTEAKKDPNWSDKMGDLFGRVFKPKKK